MSTRKTAVNYKDFIAFAKFSEEWAAEVSMVDFKRFFQSQEVVDSVAEFIGDKIVDLVDHTRFGNFMADRTYVEAIPTSRGVTFHIGGYSEQEMKEMGRDYRLSDEAFESMYDYNLWEMYEFHGGAIGTKGIPVGVNEKQVIKKDVAGPIAIRTSTGGTQQLKGRQGLIRGVMGQIKQELYLKILQLMESSGKLAVVSTGLSAARSKGRSIEGLSSYMQRKVQKIAHEQGEDLAKLDKEGKHVIPARNGLLVVQGGGGRFVKSPLHGKRYKAKKSM